VNKPRLAAALLAVGLVAGCTTSEAGVPTSGGPISESTSGGELPSESSTPSSAVIPAPPREISLDGLDPCTLFSDEQKVQLGADRARPDDGASAGTIYKGMKNCTLDRVNSEPFFAIAVIAVTNVDINFWINEGSNADSKLISIAGYPAAEFHTKGVQDSDCAVAVGVAKNQHLHVEFHPLSEDLKQDQICQRSEQAAEMAMQTLQTLR
jgi:hypothetical protein